MRWNYRRLGVSFGAALVAGTANGTGILALKALLLIAATEIPLAKLGWSARSRSTES